MSTSSSVAEVAHGLDDEEERVVVDLELRPLMRADGVLDGQLVEVELAPDGVELAGRSARRARPRQSRQRRPRRRERPASLWAGRGGVPRDRRRSRRSRPHPDGLRCPDANAGAGGGDRRWGRRLLDPLLADAARLGRRRPRRAGRPHVRLHVPLGRARRPAAELALADEDDDGERRPLPDDRRRGRSRDGLARGRVAAARVVAGAARGDRPPGRLGEDVRAPARADLAPRRRRSCSRR